MLKALFFDAAGTLIHLPCSVGVHYREVALKFGADLDAAELENAFRFAWANSPARSSDHRPRADDDKGWWRNLVYQVLARTLPGTRLASFDTAGYFEALYAHFAEPDVWAVYPEVPDVLAELRERGFALAVISNFDRRLYAVFKHLRLDAFFQHIIISSEVGADKPDPFIFEHALKAMQVSPSEAIHVGDDPKRDWGAEAVGLRVFRLARPAMNLRHLLPLLVAPADQ